MKRAALAMSVVFALCLLGACDNETPETTEAQTESVATTTTAAAATATPTPSPTPTPVPVPVFVKETYSVKNSGRQGHLFRILFHERQRDPKRVS